MAYWIHENGETIGPLKAIEILERAQPETLVSHGQEWVRLSHHPDFTYVANARPSEPPSEPKAIATLSEQELMPDDKKKTTASIGNPETQFWIQENSETTGPFSGAEICCVAGTGTLVSHGQQWVRFELHPAFQPSPVMYPVPQKQQHPTENEADDNRPSILRDASIVKSQTYEGDVWVAMVESEGQSADLGTCSRSSEGRNGQRDSVSDQDSGLIRIIGDQVASTSDGIKPVAILGIAFLLTVIVVGAATYVNHSAETKEKGATAYVNHGVETEQESEIGKAIRRADAHWNAGRHEEAISGYQELIGDKKTQYRRDDAKRMLERVIEFHVELSNEEEIPEYVLIAINSGVDLQFSSPQVQKTYDDLRNSAEAHRRKTEAQKETQRNAVWAFSEPIDFILSESASRSFSSVQGLVNGSRDELREIDRGMVSLDGYVARVRRQGWQATERWSQREMLEAIARVNCQCIDPDKWKAEIRDADTGALLAAISPNGLRALWTPEGRLPARVSALDSVDTSSPMSRGEQIRALKNAMDLIGGFFDGHHLVHGTVVQGDYRFADFGTYHRGMIAKATAEPVGRQPTASKGSLPYPEEILIVNPDDGGIPRIQGTEFRTFLVYNGEMQIEGGQKTPAFGATGSSSQFKRLEAEYNSLSVQLGLIQDYMK